MKVLISTYAVCPPTYKTASHPGSEFIVAWNIISNLSRNKGLEITVLFGATDVDFCSVENFECIPSIRNLRFIRVKPSARTRFIHRVFGWVRELWPLVLRSWLVDVRVIAAVLHAEHRFDVVHQLGPCGFKNPGRLYELNVPSVWGPIIGWHYYNLRLAYTQGFRLLIYAIGWNLANYVYSHDLNIKRAANGYDRFIFGTPETRDRFARRFGVSGVLLPEQGIVSDVTSNAISNERLNGSQSYINRSEDASLHVIWVGTIEFRKNLKLLLEVIRNLQSERFIFHIVGDGPQSFDLFKEYKDVFEMPTVFQYKRLPRADLLSLMRRTDVIVFTTLAEGNTSVLFEALEGSIVPIGPNINGFSNTLGEGGGILIDYNQSYRDIVEAYSIALKSLLKPEKYIDQLCRTSLKKKRFLFDEITSTYYEIYQSAVRKHRD